MTITDEILIDLQYKLFSLNALVAFEIFFFFCKTGSYKLLVFEVLFNPLLKSCIVIHCLMLYNF